jgi:hypothetical protein
MNDSHSQTENNLTWRKSSRSGGTGGNCVEVASFPDGNRGVRDSKDPDGVVIVLTARQWAELARTLLAVIPRSETPALYGHPR